MFRKLLVGALVFGLDEKTMKNNEKEVWGVVVASVATMIVATILIWIGLCKQTSKSAAEENDQRQKQISETVATVATEEEIPVVKPVRIRFTNVSIRFVEPSDWKNLTNTSRVTNN